MSKLKYVGYENNRKQKKYGTKIKEITDLVVKADDFTDEDIVKRTAKLILGSVSYMNSNRILSNE